MIGKSTTIDQLIEEEGFEAVFIGSGAGLPMFMGIPGENANEVFSANEYLTRSNLMKAFDSSYDTPIAAGKKLQLSAVETLRWMLQELHSDWEQKYMLYTEEAKQSSLHE